MDNDFDIAATKYDATFTFSNIGKAQRHRVYKYIKPIIQTETQLNILELNCGTGEDAICFSKLGHQVIATDISEAMIAVSKAKKHSSNLKFIVQDINTLHETSFNQKFDFIFSNFGGLNCLSKPQLEQFLKSAKKLLTPSGKLVLVIMPKKCLWENLYFSLKGDFKKAIRRNTSKSLEVHVDGVTVKTWYYNPEDIINLTTNRFYINKIKPIGLAIPPSYLENSILTKKVVLSIFKGIDAIATPTFLAKYADHFLIELQLK
ncbi:class I SAM-dependent methyltransferase [Algibacter miyuki]|uniref:Class I SAM-dependent methyltransferase n=1 Tax=Algibacter miyuki TaxID=1306933 RepID=A0ABV5GWP1_9FLAO|nr:class I SAM-dependent methyltransferase [Algibacter miyuki]MDN3664297.1 class I SAM-dependent methyltransferase [Algibacter miyuki]